MCVIRFICKLLSQSLEFLHHFNFLKFIESFSPLKLLEAMYVHLYNCIIHESLTVWYLQLSLSYYIGVTLIYMFVLCH